MPHLIHVGNSYGVRIPKAIINQVGFNEDTPLAFKVTEGGLLISPLRQPREGWEEAFKPVGKRKHKETLLIGEEVVNEFDEKEWTW